jgi:hypothetical protein
VPLTSAQHYGNGDTRDMNILAYIDPGSGSLLLQAIVAGLLAIPFFFRRTIGGFVGRLRGGADDSRTESAAAGPARTDRPSTDAEEPRR